MKKIKIIYILLISLFLFTVTSCTKDEHKYDGELIVATNCEFPPFEYMDIDGTPTGIDIDLATEIAKILNYKLEIKDMSFNSVITAIETKQANIAMAGLTISEDRKKSVDFCNPYFEANQVVIGLKNSNAINITNYDDLINELENKKIGYQVGTVGEYFVNGDDSWGFNKITGVTPVGYTSGSSAILALQNKQIDYVIVDKVPAQNFVLKNNQIDYNQHVHLTEESYAFAVAKGDTELAKKVNDALDELKENGKFDEIVNKYFSNQATTEQLNFFEKVVYILDNYTPALLEGLGNTLLITILAFIIGLVLGCVIAIIRIVPKKGNVILNILDKICIGYTAVIRGTPVVVQLLLMYFGILASTGLNAIVVAIIVFGLNSSAYMSEILRAGIMSVDSGQTEAGRTLGLSYMKTTTSIVMPQAFKNTLPTILNELISLLKETSVAGFITVADITFISQRIVTNEYTALAPYLILAIIYFIIVVILSSGVKLIERRLRVSDRNK